MKIFGPRFYALAKIRNKTDVERQVIFDELLLKIKQANSEIYKKLFECIESMKFLTNNAIGLLDADMPMTAMDYYNLLINMVPSLRKLCQKVVSQKIIDEVDREIIISHIERITVSKLQNNIVIRLDDSH